MHLHDLLSTAASTYTERTSAWLTEHFSHLATTVADPVVTLLPPDLLPHQVTAYSYLPAPHRPHTIGAYQLENTTLNIDRACVYARHDTRELIIGYRGTDIRDRHDLMSDAEIILGISGVDERVRVSLELYDAMRILYPTYTKHICGHSLGGTIAYIIAKHREPDRCTVFNPGSAPNALFIQMITETVKKTPWTTRIFTYKILGDMISTCSFVGTTKVFRIPAADPIALHSLAAFTPQGALYTVPEI